MEIGSINSFKLTTGEEIVGKVTAISDDSVVVHRPIMLGMRPVQGNPDMFGLTFVPWIMSVDVEELGDVNIPRTSILADLATPSAIASQYTMRTTSLQIATSSSLLQG